MQHDGDAGLEVGARHRSEYDLFLRRHARDIAGGLEDPGLDVGAADALLDLANEHPRQLIGRDAGEETRHVQPPSGAGDDLDARPPGGLGQQLDIPSQVERGRIDERVDSVFLGRRKPGGHALHGIGAEKLRVVAVDPGRPDHDVLVHEREAEIGSVEGAED